MIPIYRFFKKEFMRGTPFIEKGVFKKFFPENFRLKNMFSLLLHFIM